MGAASALPVRSAALRSRRKNPKEISVHRHAPFPGVSDTSLYRQQDRTKMGADDKLNILAYIF
jgi:hypothetical protein